MHPRLVGVETEFSLAWVPREPGGRAPLPREIYAVIEEAVRAEVPALPASMPKGGVFLATGGLLHYEAPTALFSTGLLEMATPECLGPLEAARYHHAQDERLGRLHPEAEFRLRSRGYEGELVIGKASADAEGNVWGSHENYEVDDPVTVPGFLLLLFAFPAFWIPAVLAIAAVYVLLSAASIAVSVPTLACRLLSRLPRAGRPFARADLALQRLIWWMLVRDESQRALGEFLSALTLPWIRAYSLLLRAVVCRRARRLLLPHLVTRLVFCGPGRLRRDGTIALSQKAPAIRRAASIFWDDGARPVFDLKNFERDPWSVWGRRKRLQVLFADSNTSRLATALRLGTTDLVLRMIEAGHPLRDLAPRDLREAIRIVDGDPSLNEPIPLAAGGAMTALEIQKYLLEEAERFCGANAEPETAEILSKWRFVLEALREDPHLLYKDLDWVAKRDLIAEALSDEGGWKGVQRAAAAVAAAPAATLAAARKIDARFHEIGPRGYGQMLLEAGQARAYFEPAQLEQAMREPASSPRARARGDAVRRHSGDEREARVGWTELRLRHPRERRRL